MTFAKTLIARFTSQTEGKDDRFAKSLNRLDRHQPAQPKFRKLFRNQPSHRAA